nr:hypothetical protein Iba_chr13dCG4780 [Ipomoea batatas]
MRSLCTRQEDGQGATVLNQGIEINTVTGNIEGEAGAEVKEGMSVIATVDAPVDLETVGLSTPAIPSVAHHMFAVLFQRPIPRNLRNPFAPIPTHLTLLVDHNPLL